MHSFRNQRLSKIALPQSTVWLLADISEFKGKQQLYTRQSPKLMKTLRETAMVQSVESSNRIEGVTVEADRLRPLVLGKARPKDRPENEIQGYRRVLNEVHTQAEKLTVNADILRRFHKLCQEGSGDAGQFKKVDNEIVELRPDGPPVIRFKCVKAKDTPAAVNELCLLYRHSLDQENVPPLVALCSLVFDFLCIHPFRDGNGRVSRLLTLLALYQHGYEVGRYISIERLIEEAKEDYYRVLQQSSQGWHEAKHDLVPWLNYSLAVIRRAYNEFADRAGRIEKQRGAKTALVESAIDSFAGQFTLTDLERSCPGVSRDMIRLLLWKMRKAKRVVCLGRGPGAAWRKKM
jgi:Fic family protein